MAKYISNNNKNIVYGKDIWIQKIQRNIKNTPAGEIKF